MAKFFIALLVLLLSACATTPPKNHSDLCAIFYEKEDWYADALTAQKKWGTPIAVQMAIIHQESRYESNVRPPRDWFLGLIPLARSSSAYGYGQAQDSTWDWYKKSTDNSGADRDDFADVVDFIGWYTNVSQRKLGISKWDAEKQYLAYHEGHGGYSRGTYLAKPWLRKVAKKVANQAARYTRQLKTCESQLDSGWSIWPF
jgi:hypothetical protein|tara:strand:+ start:15887 stop:16489 length:603 start_codon:yes stop_codon:yes gene_type:complete